MLSNTDPEYSSPDVESHAASTRSLQYETKCPYFRDDNKKPAKLLPCKFRLNEHFSESRGLGVYTGDSFGDQKFIDVSQPRQCSQNCFCRSEVMIDGENHAFVFTVTKRVNSASLRMHSAMLSMELLQLYVKPDFVGQMYDSNGNMNVLALLRNVSLLEEHLRKLSELDPQSDAHGDNILIAEMTLLVNGLLKDPAVFQSFGYKCLHENGYLTLEKWQEYERANIDRDVDTLDQAYQAVDMIATPCSDTGSGPKASTLFTETKSKTTASQLSASELETIGKFVYHITPDVKCERLSMAAYKGDAKSVQDLLDQGVDPNSVALPFYLGPALFEAIKAGHQKIAQMLVERGASVNGMSVKGFSTRTFRPLTAALRAGDHTMATSLVQQGADIRGIFDSSSREHWILAKALLHCNVDANELLKAALEAGIHEKKLLAVLLDGGASLDTITAKTQDCIADNLNIAIDDLATFRSQNVGLIEATASKDIEKMDLAIIAGAEPSWALPTAYENRDCRSIAYLLDRGAETRYLGCYPDQLSAHEENRASSMLYEAVSIGHEPLVRLLLHQGAYPDTVDLNSGRTPLVESIATGRENVVSMLLNYGASADMASTGNTESPLEAAQAAKNSTIVSMLLRSGAHYKANSEDHPSGTRYYQISDDLGEELLEFAGINLPISQHKRPPTDANMPETLSKHRTMSHAEHTELCSRRLKRRSDLEVEYGNPEAVLQSAARRGDHDVMQTILTRGRETFIGPYRLDLGHQVNLDAVFNDTVARSDIDGLSQPRELTALMAAVLSSDHASVELLVRQGADIDKLTNSGTALSLAAEVGFEAAIYHLLRWKADLHVAIFKLRTLGANPKAIRQLTKVASRIRNDLLQRARSANLNFSLLRLEFVRGHKLMNLGARASLSQELSNSELDYLDLVLPSRCLRTFDRSAGREAWGQGIEEQSRAAWNRGIAVLRGLCKGVLPETIADTLMFLNLAKAISTTMDANDLSDRQPKFFQDLSRWQVLFTSEDGSLQAFQEAVLTLWDVDLQIQALECGPDSECLLQFQNLAATLVRGADESLHFTTIIERGLLFSQKTWLAQSREYSPERVPDARYNYDHSDQNSENHPLQAENLNSTNVYDHVESNKDPYQLLEWGQMLRNDLWLNWLQPVAALLMAGAIFATIILFLSELHHSPQTSNGLMSMSTHDRGDDHSQMLESALNHILSVTCISERMDPHTLQSLRTRIGNAIRDGVISSFSQMTRLLSQSDFHNELHDSQLQTLAIKSHLLAACAIWKSSYTIQESHRAIQIYLGVKRYVSIVPQRVFPQSYKHNDARASSSPLEIGNTTDTSATDTDPSALQTTPSSDSEPHPSQPALAGPRPMSPQQLPTQPPHNRTSRTFCEDCKRDFRKIFNYNKHRRDKHEGIRYSCRDVHCSKTFSRHAYRQIHEGKKHHLTLG